ncbi:MAG: tRNA lysidine(34) synthetase TilS, partial [Nitrospirae bacterium]
LERRLLAHLRRRRLLAAGDRVVVACSGGGDSTALLHLLARLARPLPLELVVACVDHGLRPEAAAEAERVRAEAEGLGLPFHLRRLDPSRLRRPGASLQAVAREHRYRALESVRAEAGARWIATAHTADDVAETVVMNLVKGAARPLGIAERRGAVVRPLLPFRHRELTAYLEARGLGWCEDASNRDRRYLRTRVRHELLPALARVNPAIHRVLGHTAAVLEEEERYLEAQLAPHRAAIRDTPEGVELEVAAAARLPLALRRRLVRAACHRAGVVKELGFVHIEQVCRLVAGEAGTGEVRLPGGIVARRRYRRLILGRQPAEPAPPADLEVAVAGRTAELPDLGLRLELLDEEPPGGGLALRRGLLELPLRVRLPRPGDRLRPAGMGGRSKRLAALFIDAKVPPEERRRTPLLIAGGEIAAVGDWRAAEGFAALPGAERVWLRYTSLSAPEPG